MKNIKNILVGVIIFFTVSTVVSYMISAVATKEEVRKINNGTYRTTQSEEKELRRTFMQECDTGEYDGTVFDQTSYCECVLRTMEADYGLVGIGKIGLNNELEKMQPYIDRCLAQQI